MRIPRYRASMWPSVAPPCLVAARRHELSLCPGGPTMWKNTTEPRPLIPALAPLYAHTPDISLLIVRVTAGLMLLPHGIPKVFTQGVAAFAAAGLAKRGIERSLPLAYVVACLETIGGLCIALGLFTRFFAVAVAIEMAVITYRFRLGQSRLRIRAVLGADNVRHRAARRRAVLAGSEDWEGVVVRIFRKCAYLLSRVLPGLKFSGTAAAHLDASRRPPSVGGLVAFWRFQTLRTYPVARSTTPESSVVDHFK
jgi:uncharacterized membrane protein YphA (DoxX/SURF4 family)